MLPAENFPNLAGPDEADARFKLLDKLEALSEEYTQLTARRRSHRFLLLASKAWREGRTEAAGRAAMRAVKHDDTNVMALQMLGRYLERMGHMHKALVTYERAYQLEPDNADTILCMGITAFVMRELETAQKMFRLFIAANPQSPHGYNNLANALIDDGKADEAIDVLRTALLRMPHVATMWSTLGMVLTDAGRAEESFVFFEEAIRLDPACGRFYHNIAYGYQHVGRLDTALEYYDKALEMGIDPADALEVKHSRAISLIGLGQLEEGFADYEVRHHSRFRSHVHHVIDAPYCESPDIAGKTLLIVAEQGLGDEIMFAGVLPDVQRALGPQGKLEIAIDARMVALFQRSFPEAVVGPYLDRSMSNPNGRRELRLVPLAAEPGNKPDAWAMMGTPLVWFRKHLADFPHEAFLKPDPARLADYRRRIEQHGHGLKVGICWRSMMLTANRGKFYSALDLWGPILKTPGITFVNLQYGDCAAELAHAEALHGVSIQVVDGLDLKNDIDGAAALSAAVDLVISAPTASGALAAAVGTETWFLNAGYGAWPQLGTGEYPWYRKTQVMAPFKVGNWEEVMPRIAEALAARL